MRHTLAVLLTVVLGLGVTSAAGQAQTRTGGRVASRSPVLPRTASGKPDLQGLWNFRTATPLERPVELGEREFLNEQEIAALEKAAADLLLTDAPGPPRLNTPPQWLDSGTRVVETRRASLIVEPRNGRLPAMTPAGLRRTAERHVQHVDARDEFEQLEAEVE